MMTGTYEPSLVALSILIAICASYTALTLAGRVSVARGRARLAWLLGGSVAMGSGIWSMHFVAMLAFHLPVAISYDVPLGAYGPGNQHDFSWYLQGESHVSVGNVGELQEWLLGCAYVRDTALFQQGDYWQHPSLFERLRRGDCEDHALWAWRKLIELGYEAELISGRCLPWDPKGEESQRGHVWVNFTSQGTRYLFETTAKNKEAMIHPLSDVAAKYRPEFGVDHHRQRFAFNGILWTMRDREFGVKESEARRRSA